jgi:DNA polymerase
VIYLDFETRCSLDLKKVGLYNYAEKAEIICTGWALDDEPVQVAPGLPFDLIMPPGRPPVGKIVAHNAGFEKAILDAMGYSPGWNAFIDTAALAASMSLPRKLEHLAQALKLADQKDMAGHRVMLKLSRPKGGWGEEDFWEEEDKPADFATLLEYCRQDVEVMRACLKRMLPLTTQEAAVASLTGRMNDRGVAVDVASLLPAWALLQAKTQAGETRFKQLTGGPGMRSYARAAVALGLPNVQKPTVRRALRDPGLTPRVKEALDLFHRLAKSSPAKLAAMAHRASPDGRARGMLVYAGAERTGRWSGVGIQPQNFPRGMGEATDAAFSALHAGVFEMVYEHPVESLTEMLRGFFKGPLLVGDYAQIEARTLAWQAGQADLLAVFAKKEDPYSFMASRIYGRPIDKKSTDPSLPPGITPRFMGKQVVLGCGYGMGPDKFMSMLADVYDVDIDIAFAYRVVNTYRAVNRSITRFWDRLGEAARFVVTSKKADVVVQAWPAIRGSIAGPTIRMGMTEVGGLPYLWIQIPSGRRLYYCEPAVNGDNLEYWGRNPYAGGRWDRIHGYGGKFAENITQALSRDLMADAMLRLDAKGFNLVLTVHDEIVAEDDAGLLPAFKEIMLTLPKWAEGLPVDADVFSCGRYRK